MLDLNRLSGTYDVRRMTEDDAEDILAFCKKNAAYYRYCSAEATMEQVRNDLRSAPPGIGRDHRECLRAPEGDGEDRRPPGLRQGQPAGQPFLAEKRLRHRRHSAYGHLDGHDRGEEALTAGEKDRRKERI